MFQRINSNAAMRLCTNNLQQAVGDLTFASAAKSGKPDLGSLPGRIKMRGIRIYVDNNK